MNSYGQKMITTHKRTNQQKYKMCLELLFAIFAKTREIKGL